MFMVVIVSATVIALAPIAVVIWRGVSSSPSSADCSTGLGPGGGAGCAEGTEEAVADCAVGLWDAAECGRNR